MNMTRTLVSYTFYYKNGAPYFYTCSIGIFDDLNMVHHNYFVSYDEYDFITTFEKTQNEGFQPGHNAANLDEGITAVEYTKTFRAS